MGGSVAVAFRFPDGEIIAQERLTGPLSFWFTHPRVMRGEREFIDRYLNSAALGGVAVPVAPLGYGLVLVDFVSNTLFSMQGYTNLNHIETSSLVVWGRSGDADDEMQTKSLYRLLIEEKRLRVRNLCTGEETPLPDTVVDVETLVAHATELRKAINFEAGRYFVYALDSSPLTVLEFEEDDGRAFMSKLEEIGFPLTDVDRTAWQEWLTDRDGTEE